MEKVVNTISCVFLVTTKGVLFYIYREIPCMKLSLFYRIFCAELYFQVKSPKNLSWQTYGHIGRYIKLYFYEINIIYIYFTRYSVRSSISELEAVHIFKLRGQEANHDWSTDIMVDIYSCIFMSKHSIFLNIFCRSSFSEL